MRTPSLRSCKQCRRSISKETLDCTRRQTSSSCAITSKLSPTSDRFCQYMQNGTFSLVTDVSPVLYELEWRAGPYRPDLWEEGA